LKETAKGNMNQSGAWGTSDLIGGETPWGNMAVDKETGKNPFNSFGLCLRKLAEVLINWF